VLIHWLHERTHQQFKHGQHQHWSISGGYSVARAAEAKFNADNVAIT
jgi:hypothetical protein